MNYKHRKQRSRTQAAQMASGYAVDGLSDEQMVARIAAALLVGGPTTEETIERASAWASRARAEFGLLELIAHGLVSMRWSEEEQDWVFKRLDEGEARGLLRLAYLVG